MPVKDRQIVGLAITKQLEDPNAFKWLQLLYIESLRYCDITGVDSLNDDKPFVVDTLLSVIKDENRPWRVRTRACYAIGRVALPKKVKTDNVVTTVTECALQVSNAAAAKEDADESAPTASEVAEVALPVTSANSREVPSGSVVDRVSI